VFCSRVIEKSVFRSKRTEYSVAPLQRLQREVHVMVMGELIMQFLTLFSLLLFSLFILEHFTVLNEVKM
jgi:hypothetical protein